MSFYGLNTIVESTDEPADRRAWPASPSRAGFHRQMWLQSRQQQLSHKLQHGDAGIDNKHINYAMISSSSFSSSTSSSTLSSKKWPAHRTSILTAGCLQ